MLNQKKMVVWKFSENFPEPIFFSDSAQNFAYIAKFLDNLDEFQAKKKKFFFNFAVMLNAKKVNSYDHFDGERELGERKESGRKGSECRR